MRQYIVDAKIEHIEKAIAHIQQLKKIGGEKAYRRIHEIAAEIEEYAADLAYEIESE